MYIYFLKAFIIEVWLDLDGIPIEMAGEGKKEDTGESGSEP